MRLRVNGRLVGNKVYDGVRESKLEATLPAGTLRRGANTITFELPLNRGSLVDTININSLSVDYPRRLKATELQLTVDSDGQYSYLANRFKSPDISAYRVAESGTVARIQLQPSTDETGFRVRFGRTGHNDRYYLADASNRLSPSFRRVAAFEAPQNGNAELVVIAHRRFINDDLLCLVEARRVEGLTVQVFEVNRLYEGYSGGMVDPKAIQRFIADAHDKLGTETVLLVGGDSYDYRQNLIHRGSRSNIFARS